MAERIERSKDGVPCWDGSSATFQEYSELAEHWEQTIPYHKRYLCGPRLLNELSGTARRFVLSKRPGWVSHAGGVQTLLNHLRQHLGLPQLAEMSDFLARYFKNSRRKRGELMNEYITRKAELYARAESTLSRAQVHYQPRSSSTASPGPASLSGSRAASGPVLDEQRSSHDDDDMEYHDPPEDNDEEPRADVPGQYEPNQDGDSWWWSSWQGGRHDWWYGTWPNYEGPRRGDGSQQPTQTSTTWTARTVQLLPEFVQGWLLLQDAGLDVNEKNMILAAIKGDFRLDRVAQELRNQWNDEDLKRRDQNGRGNAWMTKDEDDDEYIMEAEDGEPDWANLAQSGMSAEGMALLSDAENDAQSALALIEQGRRTLKEARSRQKFVKLSRQYYGRKTFKGDGKGQHGHPPRDQPQSGVKCLSCGGNHRTADCPKKTQANAAEHQDQAPFVCMTDQVMTATMDESPLATTQQAMREGKAVIDGGATRTLGSVAAIEHLMEENARRDGDAGLAKLDTEQRPTFGFGNSSSDRCLSTVWMKIMAEGREGQLKVHTLDKGSGPILFSIETLRSLGALIDFEHDMVVFRKLSSDRVIQLERSSSGHQLLPLAQDWYADARQTKAPIPSLKDLL